MKQKDIEANNAVVTDYELENGEHPVGKLCHISTVTHAYRGYLKAVTPSYYMLDTSREIVLVGSTGELGAYAKTAKAGDARDVIPPDTLDASLIPRSSVCWIISWKNRRG